MDEREADEISSTASSNVDNDTSSFSLEYLISLLSSSRLDTLPSCKRRNIIQSSTNIIENNPIQLSKLAPNDAPKCMSSKAYKRIVSLYCTAILKLTTSTEEEKEENGTNVDSTSLHGLCDKLCIVLGKSNDYTLLTGLCQNRFLSTKKSKKALAINQKNATTLIDSFYKVALDSNEPTYAPALSLGFMLLSSPEASDLDPDIVKSKRNEYIQLFLKCTLGTQPFATSNIVYLTKLLLQNITQDEWNNHFVNTISLKLKSSPEKSLETIQSILDSLNIEKITTPLTSTTTAATLEEDLLPSLIKQLKSTKENVRNLSQLCIIRLTSSSTLSTIVTSLVDTLKSSLPQPDQRLCIYDALIVIADKVLRKQVNIEDDTTKTAFLSKCLSSLTTCVSKESKTVSSTTRDEGYISLINWMVVYKRYGSGSSSNDNKGYDDALTHVRKPTIAILSEKSGTTSAAAASEVVYSLGTIIQTIQNNDMLENIVLDLWNDAGNKFEKGLEKIVELLDKSNDSTSSAKKGNTKKKSVVTSSIVPVEGLISVYLNLINTFAASPSDDSSLKLKPIFTTILSAGSLPIDKTSFVYNKTMIDAVRTTPLVSQILPRTIALYTKLIAKQKEEDGVDSNKNSALVCILKGADDNTSNCSAIEVTAATRAIAACVAHPYSSGPTTNVVETTPSTSVHQVMIPTEYILSSIQTIVTYNGGPQGITADALINGILCHVNEQSIQHEELCSSIFESREYREEVEQQQLYMESYTKLPSGRTRAVGSSSTSSPGSINSNCVRRVTSKLIMSQQTSHPSTLAKGLLLLHSGTSLKSICKQRNALVSYTIRMIEDTIIPLLQANDNVKFVSVLADLISDCSCLYSYGNSNREKDVISTLVQKAALSLITSMGGIASNFDPEYDDPNDEELAKYVLARQFCVNELSKRLATNIQTSLLSIEALSEKDVALSRSPNGTLYVHDAEADGGDDVEKKVGEKKRGGGKGKKTTSVEDEEWERQMRKELEAKKRKDTGGTSSSSSRKNLTPEEKNLVAEQDKERSRIEGTIIGNFSRSLKAIQHLCLSDIEVGNSCLSNLYECIISCAVSNCIALNAYPTLMDGSFETLSTLASCVYEIDEVHAPTIARALTISCRKEKSTSSSPLEKTDDTSTKSSPGGGMNIAVSALPSPCASAAVAIYEMDEYNDKLSGPSFAFLLPILRAALTGPRTAPGCDAALKVFDRHTVMLGGDETDPSVAPLRKEMVVAVLELLSHDRSQAFKNPTPFDVLVSCYRTDSPGVSSGPALKQAELAPLLDERGALGTKNCRIGSMLALAAIARDHQKLVKMNPLIENRIWMNCFDENESIRDEARKTWRIVQGQEEDDADVQLLPPSPMYGLPLVPLFNHSDQSIARAAATAFARAMGMHPSSVEKNIMKICTSYIDSYPSGLGGASGKGEKPLPSLATAPQKIDAAKPAVTKKKISTGLPKKKAAPKPSALKIAGIGKPKTGAKKKKLTTSNSAVAAALLAPKQERKLDQDALASQFVTADKKSSAEKDSPEKLKIRLGILRAITSLTDDASNVELDLSSLKLLAGFLVAYGLAESDDSTQGPARNALRDVVASNGASDDAITFLLPHLEAVLSTGSADESSLGSLPTDKVPRDVAASDRRKEGAVVALGSVALHLKGPENEAKIDSTVNMLIAALKTPSEGVQSSVAACLAKLMKKGRTQDRVEEILSELMKDCLHGETLASRRGAAYGISAVVKGSGIAVLKKYEIVKRLEEASSSGSANSKEGALFAIELVSDRLGLLFEPYVIVLLPSLLKAFGDNSTHVRDAASHTAGLIMSKLSAHGVKLVMPAVLGAFDDPQWRTKQASIHMLGAMSHCAPKQLASALPKVVPKLTEAFSDTHPKVKTSAEEALDEISKVIKNPEISHISPTLLKALTDPAEGTVKALEALIETEFLHAIDAPSLSLIVPVLHRGLRDRAATTKRYGALIAGNICTMIDDPRDFVPYIPTLLPDLKMVLLDPIPDVRSTSAKALGSLTRGLGEDHLSDLRPWLVETLRQDSLSSAERSGAAQGLTEVLVAGGTSVVEEIMLTDILPLRSHPQASTREGVLWVLTFLPSTLGQAFTPLIDPTLPALLGGLSDESELVRDVALRAGRVLIRSHGKAHFDKILPSLEEGLADEDYRIRVASLTLLGDLLSMIGGTTVVKGDGDTQDDIRRAERAQAQIALVLGNETRKRVLACLYLARCDTMAVVRQSAVQVWKTVVSVTARALREILKVLVGQVVEALASGHPEKTQVAGRCLGDVTAKLGESVLPEIIPVLRDALYNGDEHTRRGVCLGLSEVINGSTKDNILRFVEIIVKVVRDALCDDDDGVRKMAASCFQSLHTVVGNRALDEVVPSLLVALEDQDNEDERIRALNGITGILSIRSRELLPYILPRLLQKPITKNHANALAGIAAVTGSTIYMHFNTIIPAIASELGKISDEGGEEDKEREEAVRSFAKSVCCNVDQSGINWLVSEIASKCTSDKVGVRKEACWLFQVLVEERKEKADFYEQNPIILRELIHRLNDDDGKVLKGTHAALNALSKNVPAEELVDHIEFIRNLIASMVSDARRRKGGVGDGEFLLPGFNIPKGLEPMLPIYQRGILYGNENIREVSAAGLGELIQITSSKYLAGPLIIKMTGPLLRIVGDRNPPAVKVAILSTLGLVLVKGGPALRAFVPQFQTTFVKALSDTSRQVRLEAIKALALLMPLSTRVDPLIKELVSGSLGKSAGGAGETAGVAAVQTATLEALASVLKQGGKKAKLPDSIPSTLEASKELICHEDEGIREGAAKVMGAACELLGIDITTETIETEILSSSKKDSSEIRHGKVCACHRIMASSVGPELSDSIREEMTKLIVSYLKDDKSAVKGAACVAIGASVGSSPDPIESMREAEPLIYQILKDSRERMEVHRAMARGLSLAIRLTTARSDEIRGVDLLGKTLLDTSLQMAKSGVQRVQYSFNDVLWLALDVASGEEGLEAYVEMANFENGKAMKALHTKVLKRIKEVDDED